MGQITSSVGLISGLNTADIIDQLIAVESRPKNVITNRNTVLEAQQGAYQQVNATLLGLRSAATRLATDAAFIETTAASSDETVATVSSGPGAAVGTYGLTVRQLVGSQQTVSRGFANDSTDPVATEGGRLTFNRGGARLEVETLLSELNGGEGVRRGFIRVTDRAGDTAVVDLSSAVSIDDVVDTLNRTTGVNVNARIEGGGLRITDATGRSEAALRVQEVGEGHTAEDLGLLAAAAGDTLTGDAVRRLGRDTRTGTLNDGNGIAGGVANDIEVTVAGGGTYALNLNGDFSLGDLADRIREETDGDLTLTTRDDGLGLRLIDNTGGGAGFTVTAVGDATAGVDLGLIGDDGDGDGQIDGGRAIAGINTRLLTNLNGGRGLVAFGGESFTPLAADTALADLLDGAGLTTDGTAGADLQLELRNRADPLPVVGGPPPIDVDLDGLTTVQDLIDAVDTATGGDLTLALDGQTLVATDNTGGSKTLVIRSASGGAVAEELGLAVDAEVSQVRGTDLNPAGVVLDSATITITNSAGTTGGVNLAGVETVDELVNRINDAGLGVEASLNAAETGLRIEDTAGGLGALEIADAVTPFIPPTPDDPGTPGIDESDPGDPGGDPAGVLAAQLGLLGTHDDGVVDGGPLGFQFFSEGSRLDALGIARGQFNIRDSDGRSATVDLTQGNEQTVADVIAEINSRGLAITARVNDGGDGILIEDLGAGAVDIEITEEGSTTARDLGLLGTFAAGQDIDGASSVDIEITATDTLKSIATKINDANVGVDAAVINDGTPGGGFRLNLSSDKAGRGGAFTLDDFGLGLEVRNLAEAKDAVVFLGGDDPADALLVESGSNTLAGLIPGATISLLTTSDAAIQIAIGDDRAAVTGAVDSFVGSFNTLIDKINEFDSYNADTQERGLLLGDPAVARVRTAIYNAVTGRNVGLSGQFNGLSQVGVTVGSGAKLSLDADKLRAALEADPDGVRDLFAFEQLAVDPETGEETDEVLAQGVGREIDKLLENLTDSENGAIERQVEILNRQLELNRGRIESIDETIADKRARLEKEFVDLERTLADLQDQQSAISGLAAAQG